MQRATPSQLHPRLQGSSLAVALVVFGIVVWALLVLLVPAAAVIVRTAVLAGGGPVGVRPPIRGPVVIGAWEESLDVLATVGVHRRASATATEVVSAGTERLGPEAATPLSPLGRLSNAARFSDDPPDVVDADTAWACTDALSGLTGPALGRWGRLRRAADLRVLFRRSDRASARRRH